MMDFFDDVLAMYADFGLDVIYTPAAGSPVTGKALFDQPGTAIIGGEILATEYTLRYPLTTFPAVKRGDSFSIGGATYTARESAQPASLQGDEMIVPLAKG